MVGRTQYIGVDVPPGSWVPWVPTASKRQAWWRQPWFVVLVVLAAVAAFVTLVVVYFMVSTDRVPSDRPPSVYMVDRVAGSFSVIQACHAANRVGSRVA